MSGDSSQTTQQQSTTQPWQPSQPLLQGILGQLQGNLGNTGITGAQTGAINSIENSANNLPNYSSQINGLTSNLLNGGGANAQSGNIQSAFNTYQQQTNPLASNTNYDPMQTPGIGGQLQSLQDQITQQVNGSFAAAGRDGSGYNQKALGQGLTAGLAPILTGQYNQNVQNQQAAANNLYNAGNTTSGLLTGLNQQGLANEAAGVSNIGAGLDATNAGANSTLAAEAQKYGIPLQNLGLLSQIGTPIAGLGSQSNGTSNTDSQMSGAQQFGLIAGGLGSLFGGGGGSTAGNIFKLFSDRRLKEDIEQVGALFDGTPVYRYRYIGQPAFQIGLMAQDVEKTTPEAVETIRGFKAVDYKVATQKSLEAA